MKYLILIVCWLLGGMVPAGAQQPDTGRYVLVIHGGAGAMGHLSKEKAAACEQGLRDALTAGSKVLKNGGTALDAVQAAVMILEDNPLFNAGKGAVFTHEGKNELDAAIMDGQTLKAGAVAGLTTVKNPVTAARAVMDKSDHVLLAGRGAEQFAAQAGCTMVAPSYFYTEDRWNILQQVKARDSARLRLKDSAKKSWIRQPGNQDEKYGTVGAVALDKQGNLAAATSTGGMTNKRFGRIGDSPLIGAGTYADNKSCAVSGTGWGEYFIRLVIAKSVCDRMTLAGERLQVAADELIMKQLPALGGDGGLIAVDRQGNIAMPFNTGGMFRAWIRSDGAIFIGIYKDETR
jgi:beta-aspartyl-peptidase (threonine type)